MKIKYQMSLEEIQKTELEILIFFTEFCKKENISYCLSNGTLLGAVKYNGFIPWDDDIDVFVPRNDYIRLMKAFNDSDQYCLFSYERNKKYKFPFAKLCDMSTLKIENNINNGVTLGVDIDIFPLDNWADNLCDAKKQSMMIGKYVKYLTFFKCDKALSKSTLKRWIKNNLVNLGRPIYHLFIHKINRIALENFTKESKYIGCVTWCIYGSKEIIPKSVFAEYISVSFEGHFFNAPIGYDIYLKCLYGDYFQDPPLEKQVTHHHYKAYKIERSSYD